MSEVFDWNKHQLDIKQLDISKYLPEEPHIAPAKPELISLFTEDEKKVIELTISMLDEDDEHKYLETKWNHIINYIQHSDYLEDKYYPEDEYELLNLLDGILWVMHEESFKWTKQTNRSLKSFLNNLLKKEGVVPDQFNNNIGYLEDCIDKLDRDHFIDIFEEEIQELKDIL